MTRKSKGASELPEQVGTCEDVYVGETPRTATIVRLTQDGVSHPMVLCEGYPKPDEGSAFSFILDNGVEYVGEVKETTASDGQMLVEFVDGIKPVRK